MRRFFLWFALAAAVSSAPLAAQTYPPQPEGPVLDQAGIITDAQEQALDQRLREYNARTGRSIVVATVEDIGGEPIDVYTRNLAEEWGIGGAETEEGVLFLVAPNDRELWITTARGVQGTLTDISTGRIIRNTVVPAFKQGDYPGGILAGVDQIIERLDMDPVQAEAIAEAEAAAERARSSEGGFPVGALIWIAFIGFFFILPMLGGGRRRRYRGGAGGVGNAVGNIILWEVGKAVASGLSDGDSGFGGFGGGSSGGGFGGFGGGGGGFNGGGAGGSW